VARMSGKKKLSGLDVATSLLTRHAEGLSDRVRDRRASRLRGEGMLTEMELQQARGIADALTKIEVARANAVLRALRYKRPAELREFLHELEARDELERDEDDLEERDPSELS
jgi:hypothetical protein